MGRFSVRRRSAEICEQSLKTSPSRSVLLSKHFVFIYVKFVIILPKYEWRKRRNVSCELSLATRFRFLELESRTLYNTAFFHLKVGMFTFITKFPIFRFELSWLFKMDGPPVIYQASQVSLEWNDGHTYNHFPAMPVLRTHISLSNSPRTWTGFLSIMC